MILKGELVESESGRFHWRILQANKPIARSPKRGYKTLRHAEAAMRRKVRELQRRSSSLRWRFNRRCEYGRRRLRFASDIRPAEYDDDDDDDDDGVAVDL